MTLAVILGVAWLSILIAVIGLCRMASAADEHLGYKDRTPR